MKTIKLRGYYVSPEPLVSEGLELLPAFTPFYINNACISGKAVYLALLTEGGVVDLSKDQAYTSTIDLLQADLYELEPVKMGEDPDNLRGKVLFTNTDLHTEEWMALGPSFWSIPPSSKAHSEFHAARFHPTKEFTANPRGIDPAFFQRHGYVVKNDGLQLLAHAREEARQTPDLKITIQRLEDYIQGCPGDSDVRAELERILGYPVPQVIKMAVE